MTFEISKKIKEAFEKENGLILTLGEIQSMKVIITEGYEICVLQKGDVTFLAWVTSDNRILVKSICW